MACAYNHLEVVRWLIARFGLTQEDAKTALDFAQRKSDARVDNATARWLTKRFWPDAPCTLQ